METQNTNRRWFILVLTNACVAVFFDSFWLMGYRIAAFDRLSQEMGYFQFALWFACFFFVSFISLSPVVKEHLIIKCSGIALLSSLFTYVLLIISTILFAPYLDPWF
jgi:hypothetical protein